MICDTTLDRMLEAEPAELRGEGESGLARHIAGCEQCAAVAKAMLEELETVDAALADFATGGTQATEGDAAATATADATADAAAGAALAAVGAGTDDADVVPFPARGFEAIDGEAAADPAANETGPRPRWTRAAWIPLVAAAALAAVLFFRQDPFPGDGRTGAPTSAQPALEPRVSVTPPPDRTAAIMETENPNITIVWLYEREET